MVFVPNLEQLKELCGSDEIKDCFKFLFIQEESEIEGLIRKVTEWRDGLRGKIAKFAELIEEGHIFSDFDVAACDGMHCLAEAQAKNGQILQSLLIFWICFMRLWLRKSVMLWLWMCMAKATCCHGRVCVCHCKISSIVGLFKCMVLSYVVV